MRSYLATAGTYGEQSRYGLMLGSVLILCLLAASVSSAGQAQQTAPTGSGDSGTALPDAPQASRPSPAQARIDARLPQTKRILGLIPNFRSVSTDEKLPRETVREKFMTATQDSFDYSSIFIPAVLAGYSMGTNADPEFHQGAAGYARYLWRAAVDQTSENYMVEFVVPTLTHEDNRYYTLGRGGLVKRTGYAISRVFVTRNDAGSETFNLGEMLGAGASAGLSSLYYPARERSFTNTGTEWGLDLAIDAASFEAKEFWPDVNRRLFHARGSIDSSER